MAPPPATLAAALAHTEPGLAAVLLALAGAAAAIARQLRTVSTQAVGGANAFGDKQLEVDVVTDAIVFDALRACGACAAASSEENTAVLPMGGTAPVLYSVAFDPLDGSSVVAESFAVGSIFGVWPGAELIGRSGEEQAAAAYVVYGPRTALVLARPAAPAGGAGGAGGAGAFAAGPRGCLVEEYLLDDTAAADGPGADRPGADGPGAVAPAAAGRGSRWRYSRALALAPAAKTFAPANLRAAAGNPAYRVLVDHWMSQQYTLRYTGAMVPDVHHALSKGQGVFCNALSAAAGPKLRLLYEVLPLAFVVAAAGGAATADGAGPVLARRVAATDERTGVCLGSREEVGRAGEAMAFGAAAPGKG